MNFPYPYHWISGDGSSPVEAVRLVGANYWYRNAALVGSAVGKKGILSVWFKLSQTDWNSYDMRLFGSTPDNISLFRADDNTLMLYLYDNAGTSCAFYIKTTGTFVADATWHHFLCSWDANTLTIKLYIDDVAAPFTHVVGPANTNIGYNNANQLFGANWLVTKFWSGEISEFYFEQKTYLDLAVVANRRKFITASKRPVALGANGQSPTGTAPIWYHSGNTLTFPANKGTGGPFTDGTAGSLQVPSNTPSTVFDPFTKFLWHCDGNDASRQFYDSSGPIGHVLSYAGTPVIRGGGSKVGFADCVYFNGTPGPVFADGGYIWLDGSSDFAFGTGDFTIDFWIWKNPPISGLEECIVDFSPNTGGSGYQSLWVRTDGTIGYYVAGSAYVVSSNAPLPLNIFNHIAIVRSGGVTRMFINGVMQTQTYADSTNYGVGLARPVFGAIGVSGATYYFTGYLDEIRVLKGQAAWTANFTPPTAPYTS